VGELAPTAVPHDGPLPEHFEDVLSAVAAFADPVLDATPFVEARWIPGRQAWVRAAG
jgi:hypothetical protein